MPLFHVGGIARNVLSPIISGGAVVAMPYFEPALFWSVVSDTRATWYYAGPTMCAMRLRDLSGDHASVLTHAQRACMIAKATFLSRQAHAHPR